MKVLVTGGCGFIGTNLVMDRLRRGDHVRVLDNCARSGAELNWNFLGLQASPPDLELVRGDVRDYQEVEAAVDGADVIFHLAAQVAVTSSVESPRADFEANALGTLNVLEAARTASSPPAVVYSSTNKVYGALSQFPIAKADQRYEFEGLPLGVDEATQLEFHSPYGCSKGTADQYTLDYARIYGLHTAVFRQSCIYGPMQYGNEDQGWVAHFVRAALRNEPITIFGDGYQVRDVLFVDDLIAAYDLALQHLTDQTSGRAYNIGGGSAHSVSLRECIDVLRGLVGHVAVEFSDWRPGDQRVYISDVRRVQQELGWSPSTSFENGLAQLVHWTREQMAAG